MSDVVRQARRALGRGTADEALVLLWNELEQARLAGDRRALQAIERLAAHIAREGDESQQREAERLLDAVREAVDEEGVLRPATAEFVGEVSTAGEGVEPVRGEEPEAQPAGGLPIGTIIWIVIVLAVVVLNVLGQTRD